MKARGLGLLAPLLLAACSNASTDLAACRYEARKIIESAPIKSNTVYDDEARMWTLVAPCMEARGYVLDYSRITPAATITLGDYGSLIWRSPTAMLIGALYDWLREPKSPK